jgi:hypothetical protein
MKKAVKSVDEEINARKNGSMVNEFVYDPEVDYEGDTGDLDHLINELSPEFVHEISCPKDEYKLLNNLIEVGISANVNNLMKIIGVFSYNYIMDLMRSRRDQLSTILSENTSSKGMKINVH